MSCHRCAVNVVFLWCFPLHHIFSLVLKKLICSLRVMVTRCTTTAKMMQRCVYHYMYMSSSLWIILYVSSCTYWYPHPYPHPHNPSDMILHVLWCFIGTRDDGDMSKFVPAQIAPRDPYQRPGESVFGQVREHNCIYITGLWCGVLWHVDVDQHGHVCDMMWMCVYCMLLTWTWYDVDVFISLDLLLCSRSSYTTLCPYSIYITCWSRCDSTCYWCCYVNNITCTSICNDNWTWTSCIISIIWYVDTYANVWCFSDVM